MFAKLFSIRMMVDTILANNWTVQGLDLTPVPEKIAIMRLGLHLIFKISVIRNKSNCYFVNIVYKSIATLIQIF